MAGNFVNWKEASWPISTHCLGICMGGIEGDVCIKFNRFKPNVVACQQVKLHIGGAVGAECRIAGPVTAPCGWPCAVRPQSQRSSVIFFPISQSFVSPCLRMRQINVLVYLSSV
jgi:hypothetical protein